MASTHKTASASAAAASGGVADWQPSVKYLLVLLLVEIIAVSILRTITNHGG